MPVKSYLAHPVPHQEKELQRILSAMPECDCFHSETHDVLVLVTSTETKDAETILEQRLKEIDALQCLVLVAGYEDPPKKMVVTNDES